MKTLKNIFKDTQQQLIRGYAMIDHWFDREEGLTQPQRMALIDYLHDLFYFNQAFIEHILSKETAPATDAVVPVSFDAKLVEELLKCGFKESPEGKGFDEIEGLRSGLRSQLYDCLVLLEQKQEGDGLVASATWKGCQGVLFQLSFFECLLLLGMRNVQQSEEIAKRLYKRGGMMLAMD